MHEGLIYLGTLLTALIGIITLAKFLFYTKSEVNSKLAEIKEESDKHDNELLASVNTFHSTIKDELTQTREKIFEKIVEEERHTNILTKEIYDKLNIHKQSYDDVNKSMLEAISQLKQESKEQSAEFVNLLNAVKDELKTDYINRYNELLALINTKVSVSDFDRLETKFDKVTNTITELKTIVTMQLDEHGKNQ